MAKTPKTKDKYAGKKRDDDYYAEQWARLQEEEEERKKRFERIWFDRWGQGHGEVHYTPWLVIPAVLSDYGARPLESGIAHWKSPHIGVFSPDPSGIALAGAQNTVWARVFNLGAMTSAPTRVRFFWADPSVGLGPADAHPIGETMVEVPPLRSVLVQCPVPWVPSYLNNGHECLFADAENAVFDPMTAPFAPRQDRHVGQRNIQVLPAANQTMMMWLPGGAGAFRGELRALVLRGRARELTLQKTPVDTLLQLSNAIQLGFARGNREGKNIMVKREAADLAIGKLALTGETREIRDERPLFEKGAREESDRWGERVFEMTTKPGVHQQLRIDFNDLDLAREEVVQVQLTWLAEGHLIGGYTVTLANREWFDPERKLKPRTRGGPMTAPDERSEDLRELVIRHNPHAEATLEIAGQLKDRLPLKSAKELSDGIKFGDAYFSPELLAQLAEPLMPIETVEDLVKRVGAMLRMFSSHARQNPAALTAPEGLLASRLAGAKPREAVRQVLFAQGEPIFDLPPEEKE